MNARDQKDINNLPQSVQDFIKLIIKKMGYRRKVRLEVARELTSHFEDELRDCTDQQLKLQKAQKLIEEFGDVKLLGILLRRAKKRCRPLWRTVTARIFQTIGIMILCLVLYVAWFLSGKPVVTTDYIAELNRLIPPAVDDSLNAAPQFDQAMAICPNMPDYHAVLWRLNYLDANDDNRHEIRKFVNQCSDSLDLITAGSEKPYFWKEYKTGGKPGDDGSLFEILMPHLADFRRLARILCQRAQIHADEGNFSAAFDDLTTCCRFGKLVAQGDKTLVEQLVGIAVEALSTYNIRRLLWEYDINSQQLVALQNDFSKAQAGQDFRVRYLSERMMIYDEIQRSFTDGIGGGHLYSKRLLALAMYSEAHFDVSNLEILGDAARCLFYHPNKAETKQQADAFYDFLEETSNISPAQLRRNEIDLEKQAQSIVEGNVFLRIMTPALSRVHQIQYRLKVDTQSVPVIIAALRFKADTGQYPQDLTELQHAGYINEIPIDPFSNRPLVYKQSDDSFILYSVGLDFEDNGGVPGTNSSGKTWIWADEGDAVFWPVME